MVIVTTVSVVVSTWNRAGCIEKAVRSALAQKVSPLEVLVCDDGSTDNTEQIIRSIDDNRVRWLPGKHAGRPAIPRNRGIQECRGEWIAFLDDDDEWLPEKLEKQLSHVKKLGFLAVSSNALRSILGNESLEPYFKLNTERLTLFDLLKVNSVISSSAMIHRSMINYVEGYPETSNLIVGEDYALWLRVSTLTDFAYLNEPLVVYLDNPTESIRANNPDAKQQYKAVIDDYLNWLKRMRYSKNNKLHFCLKYLTVVLFVAIERLKARF